MRVSTLMNVFSDAAVAPVLARYARPTYKAALTDVVTDGIFRCNARRVARAASAHGVPVYLYQWTPCARRTTRVLVRLTRVVRSSDITVAQRAATLASPE
jgi:carboxylesterase type B